MPGQVADEIAVPGNASIQDAHPTLGESLCRFFDRHEAICMAALLLAIFAELLRVSNACPMWFDELLTLLVAGQPTLHEFALAMPADANPPLLALLVRGLIHIVGPGSLADRLPSMLAFVAACGGLYVFVRRRCGSIAGLFAIAFLLYQPAWVYGFEARAYALLLAFLTIALVCWQKACWQKAAVSEPRRLQLAAMTACIAGAMLTHHLGLVIVGFPIVVGETVRLYRRRQFDWPLYSTFLVALPVLALTLPMAHRTRAQLLTLAISHQPKITFHVFLDWLRDVKFYLPTLFALPSLVVLGALVLATWRGKATPSATEAPLSPIPPHEIAAAIGAILLIPVTLLIMMPTSNYYNIRYGIGCLIGVAILVAFALSIGLGRRRDVLAAFILLLGLGFVMNAQSRAQAGRQSSTSFPTVPVEYSEQPLVTANVFAFFPDWWYAPPEQRQRLHFLFDPQTAANDNNGMPEAALMLEKGRFPANLDQYDDFIATHDRFVALIPPGLGGGFKDRLVASGFQLTPVGGDASMLFEARKTASAP